MTSIEDEVHAEAERRWPHQGSETRILGVAGARGRRVGFVLGAKWAADHAEAIDRMGPAAGCHLCVGAGGYEDHGGEWVECSCQQANREPSDAEVTYVAEAIRYDSRPETEAHTVDWPVDEHDAREIARAALRAAREVRRG